MTAPRTARRAAASGGPTALTSATPAAADHDPETHQAAAAGSPDAEEPCDHQDEPYVGQLSLRYAEGDWSPDAIVCVRCGRERNAA